ncbi:hypothetical protein M0805_007285 [Coniferiporia weirii]|nr:hypothetical protein M0805_007285 [Coniferiporia weirii]
MASTLPPSPFTVGSFRPGQEGEASPADFLVFLQTLLAESLDSPVSNRIPASAKESWTALVEGLSEHFLSTFPGSSSELWNALQEKIKLCSASLDVIERAALRVDGLFADSDKRSITILRRLLKFYFILSTWATPASKCANVDSPGGLRRKVVETVGAVIGAFADNSRDSAVCKMFMEKLIITFEKMLSLYPAAVWPLKLDCLDSPELVSGDDSDPDLTLSFDLEHPAHFCVVLAGLFGISVLCFKAEQPSPTFVSKFDRQISLVTRRMMDFFLSSDPARSRSVRIDAISSVLKGVEQLVLSNRTGRDLLASVPTILLIFRLREGPSEDWRPVDMSLLDIFNAGFLALQPSNSGTLALELVLQGEWGESGEMLISCVVSAIRASLKEPDNQVLRTMHGLLQRKEVPESFNALAKEINLMLDSGKMQYDGNTQRKRKRSEDNPWRTQIVRMLQPDVFENENWLPEENLSDDSWVSGILTKLEARLTHRLGNPSASVRLQVVLTLKRLLCCTAHPDQTDCRQSPLTNPQTSSFLPTYVTCLIRLQNGTANEVDPAVLRAAQDALVVCLKHYAQGFRGETLDVVSENIFAGMQNTDRSVRLASGRSLEKLVQVHPKISMDRGIAKRLDHIFENITALLQRNKDTVKETTLITLGLIGKASNQEILGRVLFRLFTQLDRNSILLKGVTYMQLLALAKHHKKTPYMLVSPYMQEIATHVVSVMPRQPNALLETCRFLSLSRNDFLSVTLPHTLPQLFATCDSAALDNLHNELGKPISGLFLNASADVLAHVFLLKKAEETDKALRFILRILSEAANNAKIGLLNVVKSCVIPLLGKLVICMGDPDDEAAKDAVQAILKVERALNASTNGHPDSSQTLGNFLKGYMLGIIAILSDVLQDVQGRKTDDVKRKVLFGLNELVKKVGPSISAVAPQIMATLQTTVCLPSLSVAALHTWYSFLTTLSLKDLGPHVGPTTAALVNIWPSLNAEGRELAKQSIDYILNDAFTELGDHADDIVDFSCVPELTKVSKKMRALRRNNTIKDRLERILERTFSDNSTVVAQALEELKSFMVTQYADVVCGLASGDVFDPLVGHITKSLLTVVCRDGENIETLRLLAFECMGILGAADPDRFDMLFQDDGMVVLSNYTDENEAMQFALHLVQSTLVGAFRSTSDIKYQSHLAFAIQELLKFCKFTPELAVPGSAIPLKVRSRWNSLPKHVLETVTPLLEARFAVNNTNTAVNVQHPVYLGQSTYREWIQLWTAFLITRTNGHTARTIFDAFRLTVRNKDVGVAHQLLPHLILNILISGGEDDTQKIRSEIIAVLEDQLDGASKSSSDKRLLSAQAIFMLMDHLSKWIRVMRQELSVKRSESKRARHNHGLNEAELQVTRVDSILASIDQVLVAKAAFECKAYARSLMNFEKQIISLRNGGTSRDDLQVYYDRLHEIYSHLDEPDGMEGISAFITLPSLEHQIRQHESTGRWTSAQSCWEVRLQQSQDKLDYHLGLLRCLRNLGHYDSLRTHIQGILVRNPEWEDALAGFRVEGAWMNGDWDAVRTIVSRCREDTWEIAIARLLLALESSDATGFISAISATRLQLGTPITAAGERGYRRAYDAVLKLHLVRDIETIRQSVIHLHEGGTRSQILPDLFSGLSHRLYSTLPTFRTREPILSIHRTAFSLSRVATTLFKRAVGRAWLDSAKIARKAGHWQTAYSAVLQAQECQAPLTFFQSAKLVKASGEPLRALYELDSSLRAAEERRQAQVSADVMDITDDDQIDGDELKRVEAKAKLLRARWMQESERFDVSVVAKELSELAKSLSEFESAHFHAGHFQDECYKALNASDKRSRGPRMNLYTVRAYSTAIRLGSKYAYQTIPRLLTIWLDMGEDNVHAGGDSFVAINTEIQNAISHTPVYKWLTAFPQIVSRVDHKNNQVFATLSLLISTVLQEYPQQGLWLFMAVVKSTKSKREKRGRSILEQLRSNPKNARTAVPSLIVQAVAMATELLRLCDYPIKDEATKTLSMAKDFPALAKLAPSPLIIPLQESMTVALPATSSSKTVHQPFPPDAPTIMAFYDEVDVMKSLAKPRKITIQGSNGHIYMFLGKPKDDLRKDARLMDFNSIINKLLRTNSESRRRQLRIRTYSVVTLNEECGFIQWVPNTTPVRPILLKYYSARGIDAWNRDMSINFAKIKEATDKEASKIFQEKILNLYSPIFHEWFLDTFPEPTAWLSSRLAYGRTAAVMSMVGFILGLGDRHLENILLDVNSGDVVHVDFNCLFEKGKTLETPERVPFRLTNNMVDALGVTGVEGVFRNASEITLQLLRDNKDVLMSVLDAFIHDPLVEWEDEKRKMERQAKRAGDINAVKESVDLRKLAKTALTPIERKLRGMYAKDANRNGGKDKEISTSNLVQMLIEEATDLRNLSKMYPGWAPWH